MNEIHTNEPNRDLFNWIVSHKPESEKPAQFYSFNYLFYGALGYRTDNLTDTDIEEIIRGDLECCFEELWEEHDIAVQPFAVEGGRTGIRVMSVL